MNKIKYCFYFANLVIALVAGVDCYLWGMALPSSSLLWYNGVIEGYIELSLLSIIITLFCLFPSFMIKTLY
jgi:hypothetical protein